MAALIDPPRRIRELMDQHRIAVASVAAVLQRSQGYVRRYLARDDYAALPTGERETLSRFFAVPVRELGG